MKSDTTSYERYQRQTILKEFGIAGQQKLLQSKVLVIGAGGLGCPALQYLAAAGTGHIGIADGDTVSITNLHRQVIHGTKDVGKKKLESAKETINDINPNVRVDLYERLYRRALRNTRVDLDLNGDGRADTVRALNVLELQRV